MVVALGVLIAYNYLLHVFYPEWKPGQTNQNPPAATQVEPLARGGDGGLSRRAAGTAINLAGA